MNLKFDCPHSPALLVLTLRTLGYLPPPPLRTTVTKWVARLTRNVEVIGLSHIKGPPVVSMSKKTYPYRFSTGWFQERIRAA